MNLPESLKEQNVSSKYTKKAKQEGFFFKSPLSPPGLRTFPWGKFKISSSFLFSSFPNWALRDFRNLPSLMQITERSWEDREMPVHLCIMPGSNFLYNCSYRSWTIKLNKVSWVCMCVNVLPHRAPLTAVMTVGLYWEISNQTHNLHFLSPLLLQTQPSKSDGYLCFIDYERVCNGL